MVTLVPRSRLTLSAPRAEPGITAMGTETVAIVPTLRSDYAALPNRHQQALDWYLKGIHAPVDSDRYMYSVNVPPAYGGRVLRTLDGSSFSTREGARNVVPAPAAVRRRVLQRGSELSGGRRQ